MAVVKLGIALVGAGRGGAALLAVLREEPGVTIEVVVDSNPEAPGLALARQLGLPVLHDLREIVRFPIDLVLEVTGKAEVLESLRAVVPPGVEVISARGARMLWDLVERRRLQEGRLRTVLAITHALSQERALDVLLDRVVREATTLFGEAVAKLWLRADGESMVLAAWAGAKDVGFKTVAAGEGLQGWVQTERRPLTVVDAQADPRAGNLPWLQREGLASYAGVPLMVGEEILGVLSLFTRIPHIFSAEELDLLVSFAGSAAIAIQHARYLEETRRSASAFESLAEIARSIIGSLDAPEVFQAVVEGAARVLEADASTLAVFDEATQTLTVRTDYGLRDVHPRLHKSFRLGEGMVGWVAQQLQPVFLPNFQEDPRVRNKEWARQEGFLAYGAIPLRVGEGRLVGVLTVFYRRPHAFPDMEVKLLTALGGLAALAIVNAELFADRQRALEAVQRAQERQIQSERLRALGEMASGIAHEFNNLLAGILGRAQLLLRQVEEPKTRRGLGVIEKLAQDGAHTVRRIQDFTRVRRSASAVEVQLADLLADALEFTRSRWESEAQAAGTSYQIVTDLQTVPSFLGEPAELRELFVNLFLNAFDAMPQGGVLEVTLRPAEGGVEIRVRDTGVGMPEEVRRRIFEPFFTTKGPRATGLGLAAAYGIVQRHGGELRVESQPGQGSTFTIRLPLDETQAKSEAPVAWPEVGPLRILVVEDEEEVREVLVEALRGQGHSVAMGRDGVEGIRLAREASYDLVVTDISLPGHSGWEIAGVVRQAHPDVPILFVTGWGDQMDRVRLAALQRVEVLPKPFGLEELGRVIARLAGTPAAP